MAKAKVLSLADELELVMERIAEREEELKPLKEREDEIRTQLCDLLLKQGLQFVKTSSGLAFGLVKGRVSFKVVKGREDEAIRWAVKEYPSILSIAAAKLNKVVQPMLELPEFIERTEGDPYLAVRS
jgi:hypothetical protein